MAQLTASTHVGGPSQPNRRPSQEQTALTGPTAQVSRRHVPPAEQISLQQSPSAKQGAPLGPQLQVPLPQRFEQHAPSTRQPPPMRVHVQCPAMHWLSQQSASVVHASPKTPQHVPLRQAPEQQDCAPNRHWSPRAKQSQAPPWPLQKAEQHCASWSQALPPLTQTQKPAWHIVEQHSLDDPQDAPLSLQGAMVVVVLDVVVVVAGGREVVGACDGEVVVVSAPLGPQHTASGDVRQHRRTRFLHSRAARCRHRLVVAQPSTGFVWTHCVTASRHAGWVGAHFERPKTGAVTRRATSRDDHRRSRPRPRAMVLTCETHPRRPSVKFAPPDVGAGDS